MIQNSIKISEDIHSLLVLLGFWCLLKHDQKVPLLVNGPKEIPVQNHRLNFDLNLVLWQFHLFGQK